MFFLIGLGRVQNICTTEEHAGMAGDSTSNNWNPTEDVGEKVTIVCMYTYICIVISSASPNIVA